MKSIVKINYVSIFNILLFLALIATYSVGYVADRGIRYIDNRHDIGYIEGLSITVIVCHIVGGILYYINKKYNKKILTYLTIITLLFSFIINLKLLEVPYDGAGLKNLQVDWLSTYYPVVWRLSSFILGLFYYTMLYLLCF